MMMNTPTIDQQSPQRCLVYLPRTFQCKDLIPLQPDTIWKIDTGVVRTLTWNEEGSGVTLGFWGKGDLIGQPLSRIKPYQIECLTPVQVHELLPEQHYLQHALLVHAWRSEGLISILHRTSIMSRLQNLLEWLADQFGHSTPEGTLLNLALTHQDLAETIHTTRVTITRLLNQLEQEGKVERFHKTDLASVYPEFGQLSRQSLLLKHPNAKNVVSQARMFQNT